MATNNYVKFLKGTYAGYQAIANKDSNHIYITTDEGGIYLGDKRLGDYILVDSVNTLTNDATLVKSTGALYYAQKENVLARWNGSDWVQINAAGLTDVTVTGASDGDYIGNVTVNTNANGTARALTINKQKLSEHATIKDHSDRIAQVEADIATLGGADNGSIADAIEAAVAPVRQAAAAADEKAQGAVDTNATQQTSIDDHETRIGAAEGAIAQEVADRQSAINGLTNGASSDYNTFAKVESKIKAAQQAADDAQTDADQLETDLSELEGRVGTNETNIGTLRSEMDTLLGGKEVTNSVAWQVAEAVTDIRDGVDEKYDTLKEVAEWIAADTTGAAEMSAAIDDHETRLAAAETTIGNHTAAIAQEVADREAAVSGLKGSTSKLHTLAALEAALGTTDGNVSQLATDLSELEERVGTNETNIGNNSAAITKEVTDRGTAINNLRTEIQGGTLETDYNTMVKLQNKIKAEAAINATQNTTLEDYETRIAALEAQLQWGSF